MRIAFFEDEKFVTYEVYKTYESSEFIYCHTLSNELRFRADVETVKLANTELIVYSEPPEYLINQTLGNILSKEDFPEDFDLEKYVFCDLTNIYIAPGTPLIIVYKRSGFPLQYFCGYFETDDDKELVVRSETSSRILLTLGYASFNKSWACYREEYDW